jgi:hypothetical protein
MFSKLRKRFTLSNVLMTFALVFAMTGGAYAAGKYVITSTKQISPKVLKSLVGKAGAAGKEGAPGKEGPAGKEGASGKEGTPGKEGTAGKEGPAGKEGVAGKEGTPGKEGPAGKSGTTGFTKTLPPGETETGTWTAIVQGRTEANLRSPISFAIPLKEAIPSNYYVVPLDCTNPIEVPVAEQVGCESQKKASEQACFGTVEIPKAGAGDFCVYQGVIHEPEENTVAFEIPGIVSPGATRIAAQGAGTTGAVLQVLYQGPAETAYMDGTWAVTAP